MPKPTEELLLPLTRLLEPAWQQEVHGALSSYTSDQLRAAAERCASIAALSERNGHVREERQAMGAAILMELGAYLKDIAHKQETP